MRYSIFSSPEPVPILAGYRVRIAEYSDDGYMRTLYWLHCEDAGSAETAQRFAERVVECLNAGEESKLRIGDPPPATNEETGTGALRDQIAMAAMRSILLNSETRGWPYDVAVVARTAYQVADAMLEARHAKR